MIEIKTIRNTSGLIIRCRGIPEDFNAVSSLYSPRFPKVIRAASSIARGRAIGTKESEKWNRSSATTFISSPLPASSSTYIHRNWRISIISTMKNVSMSGPINDFNMNLSSFFKSDRFFKLQSYSIFNKYNTRQKFIFVFVFNQIKAQRLNGVTVQRHNGITAQQRNAATGKLK